MGEGPKGEKPVTHACPLCSNPSHTSICASCAMEMYERGDQDFAPDPDMPPEEAAVWALDYQKRRGPPSHLPSMAQVAKSDPSTWERTGDFNSLWPKTRLSKDFYAFGINFHMHAIQIETSGECDEQTTAVNPDLQENLERVADLCGCAISELETITVDGRRFVVFVTPFAT